MRLCRRAPGSGLNVRLDVPGRDRRIPVQDKKTPPQDALICPPPTPPSLPFPTPQGWPGVWMAGPGWVNWYRDASDSLGGSSVPFWVAGKNSGEIWKYQSELRTSWEPAEDPWGQHRPFLWWPHSSCALLPLGGRFLQAHRGSRQQHESCTACTWPTCSPPLWATEPGWVTKVLREMFRVGGSCLSPLTAHPNAANSSCCSPVRQLTITVGAPLTFVCGRAQNS